MVLLGAAAEVQERQHDDGEPGRGFRRRRQRPWGRLAVDGEGEDPDRLGDVLEGDGAEVLGGQVDPPFHLTPRVLGEANPAGRGDALETRGDIDAVAHEVVVGLLDHVAEMNADAELDAAIFRQAGVAFDHAFLHLDRASHRVDHAAELDQRAIAGALDDAPVMHGDGRVEEVAAQSPEPRERALLVGAGEPAVTDNVRDQDRRDLSRFRHAAPSSVVRITRGRSAHLPIEGDQAEHRGEPRLHIALSSERYELLGDLLAPRATRSAARIPGAMSRAANANASPKVLDGERMRADAAPA